MAANIRMMRAFAFLGLLAAVSCSDRVPKRASPRESSKADSAIYAVLLYSLRPGSRPARVERQYEPLPDSASEVAKVASWAAAQRDHLDSALIVALARDQHAGSVAATVGDLPGIRWIDRDSARAESLRPFENTRVVQLSRVVYSSDSSRAVVYASMYCEGLCGNGTFYQFRRSPVGTWHLTGMVVRFIS